MLIAISECDDESEQKAIVGQIAASLLMYLLPNVRATTSNAFAYTYLKCLEDMKHKRIVTEYNKEHGTDYDTTDSGVCS